MVGRWTNQSSVLIKVVIKPKETCALQYKVLEVLALPFEALPCLWYNTIAMANINNCEPSPKIRNPNCPRPPKGPVLTASYFDDLRKRIHLRSFIFSLS